MTATLNPPGAGLTIIRKDAWVPEDLDYKRRNWNPRSQLGLFIRDVASQHLPADVMAELIEYMTRTVVIESALSLKVFRGPDAERPFDVEDYGVVGRKSITDLGVAYLVDAWQNIVEMETQKFHGIGTGTTAEAVTGAGSSLVTELTTEYNPNSTRATGSLTEGASANIFRTVGLNTLDGTPGAALREHAITDNATVGSGTTWDRTLFAAITLSSGDGLSSQYDLTASSGG